MTSRSAWEDKTPAIHTESHTPGLLTPYETELTYKARMESLAETERIFDELTQEKQQVEQELKELLKKPTSLDDCHQWLFSQTPLHWQRFQTGCVNIIFFI